MRKRTSKIAAMLIAAGFISTAHGADGDKVTITGEVMDTWCYVSQVMGGSDFVVGSAHHVCAVWCAAGGIPVGLLGEDGQIYMIMKYGDDRDNVASDAILKVQSHQLTVEGRVHERDGIKYLLVDKVLDDAGVTNKTHEVVGVLPAFALPQEKK